MDTQHRKIELQSPADLTYLTAQLRTAARAKLDLHLPSTSSTNEPDELRSAVESLVDTFVAQILQGMRSNISINGLDVMPTCSTTEDDADEAAAAAAAGGAPEQEEYEAFDEKLRGRLGASVAKRDALIAKISQYRRTVPAQETARFEKMFVEDQQVQGRLYEEMVRGVESGAGGDDVEGLEGAVLALQRQDEVERNWNRAIEGLGRLNKGLPETRARLERCGDVVGYLGGEGKMK